MGNSQKITEIFHVKGSKFYEGSTAPKIFIVIIFNPCTSSFISQSPRPIDSTTMHDLMKWKWKVVNP